MPNRNYNRGRAYEYRVIKLLEGVGFTANRTAGSHGHYDVVAFNRHQFRLIQVKVGVAAASPAEREAFSLVGAPANATKEIWSFKKRGQPPVIQTL